MFVFIFVVNGSLLLRLRGHHLCTIWFAWNHSLFIWTHPVVHVVLLLTWLMLDLHRTAGAMRWRKVWKLSASTKKTLISVSVSVITLLFQCVLAASAKLCSSWLDGNCHECFSLPSQSFFPVWFQKIWNLDTRWKWILIFILRKVSGALRWKTRSVFILGVLGANIGQWLAIVMEICHGFLQSLSADVRIIP